MKQRYCRIIGAATPNLEQRLRSVTQRVAELLGYKDIAQTNFTTRPSIAVSVIGPDALPGSLKPL